jgi:hypothetical protein
VLEAVADLATHRRQTRGAAGFLNANLEAMHQQGRGSDSANDDAPAEQLARSSRGQGPGAAAAAAGSGGSAGGAVPGLEMGPVAMTAGAGSRVSSNGGGVSSDGGGSEQREGRVSVPVWLADREQQRRHLSQQHDAGHLPAVAS